MAKLYPPLIEGTIPAFYGDSITIPFSMNKTVNEAQISGFSIKIKTVQNNSHLGTLTSSSFDKDNYTVTFSLDEKLLPQLTIGQYYKIQMAFIDTAGDVGYYSTVGIIKKTSKPTIYIDKLQKEQRNQALDSYIGIYKQDEDWTEKVYSYNFKIWDINNNIIADSGELLHMGANDESPNESKDVFTMTKELINNSTYYIQYTITTTGGLVESQKYRLIPKQSVLPEIDAELRVVLNEENGYVDISLQGADGKNGYEKIANGAFLLTRRKYDEPGNWEALLRFELRSKRPSSWHWKDFTVEQGVSYIYSLQQYSEDLYSQRILSKVCIDEEKDIWIEKEIYVNFEHAFLFDGERQLKIKYNPKVSSFKTTILESKMETLGSKHPFIFRNGLVSYKDFPISGLISYLMDEENLFNSIKIKDGYRKSSFSNKKEYYEFSTNINNDNIKKERDFKLSVLDWLNNGEPKLYRSPTEGNYIVRLMNNSLSPMDQVGRMLHSFQTNAYEIADYNYENLNNYGFIKSEESYVEKQKIVQWATVELLPKLLDFLKIEKDLTKYTNNVLPKNTQVNELSFQGMLPGDKIKITYADGQVLDIVIGATGAYAAANIAPISSVQLYGANAAVNGIMTYCHEAEYSNTFGLYSQATNIEIPAKQYFGSDLLEKNIMLDLEDLKTSILNVYYINFEKRPIQILYADAGKDIVVDEEKNPTIIIDKSNLYYDRYKMNKVNLNDLDSYMLYQIRLSALDNTTEIQHNQDYFLDNRFEELFPVSKNKAYFDGKTKTLFGEDKYSTKVYIDNVEIDLNETEDYAVVDLKPKELYIGLGITMTIGYGASVLTYHFEVDNNYLSKVRKDIYDEAVKNYNKSILNYNGDDLLIDVNKNSVNLAYQQLLDQIDLDLEEYKEANGLGD